jgi:hypothetical protein
MVPGNTHLTSSVSDALRAPTDQHYHIVAAVAVIQILLNEISIVFYNSILRMSRYFRWMVFF